MPDPAPPPLIEFRGLTKAFAHGGHEAVQVVEPLDLTIVEGEFVVFVGPSGCGKTTVMRMVGGLETPTTGEVRLRGAPVTGQVRVPFDDLHGHTWRLVDPTHDVVYDRNGHDLVDGMFVRLGGWDWHLLRIEHAG